MIGISLELIQTITLLCTVSSLENTKGKWTELQDTAKYQHVCLVRYLDCIEDQSGLIEDRLLKCIKTREVQGK